MPTRRSRVHHLNRHRRLRAGTVRACAVALVVAVAAIVPAADVRAQVAVAPAPAPASSAPVTTSSAPVTTRHAPAVSAPVTTTAAAPVADAACTDVPSRVPGCMDSAANDGVGTLGRAIGRIAYPVKPEAPAAPAGGGTTVAAANAARAVLAGKGVYVCNEISAIPGPNCGSDGPYSDADLVAAVRGTLGANQLWARCGDSRRGFPQAHKDALVRIRPVAAAAGLRLVCWDVPNFWDVAEDARRLGEESLYADAVASDLESGTDAVSCAQAAIGCGYAGPELETDKGGRWATAYSGWFRHWVRTYNPAAGDNYPAVVITMQPQTHSGYPFGELLSGFAVASPMMYRGVTWFNNNDPGAGEKVRAGNPFVATGYAVLRDRGWNDAAHAVHTTGMTYDGGPDVYSHENQIRTDLGASQANGGIGFAGFDFGDLVARPAWAAAFRQTNWIGPDTIFPFGPDFPGGLSSVAGGTLRPGVSGLLVFGAGPGGGPDVQTRRPDGSYLSNFFAYDAGFRGGVNVAVGDLDGDGVGEIVTGAGPGGGPHLRVFSATGEDRGGWFPYDGGFRGGVNVAVGDLDGDGRAEVVTGAGPGGGPHLRVFSATGEDRGGWFPYDGGFRGGVNVAVGDLDGDGRAEIVTAAGPGGGPHVRVFSGAGGDLGGFFAYGLGFAGGVSVAVADVDGDGRAEIVTGAGPGGGPHLRIWNYDGPGAFHELTGWFPFALDIARGLKVAGVAQSSGPATLLVGLGPGVPTVAVMRKADGSVAP